MSPVAATVANTCSRVKIFTALSSAWSAGQGPWRTPEWPVTFLAR